MTYLTQRHHVLRFLQFLIASKAPEIQIHPCTTAHKKSKVNAKSKKRP